ncbi:MAG: hypothetical protein Q4D20_00840 [Clostridia bacterium]|nr:hypothetical protein [Clostridia bacterium]
MPDYKKMYLLLFNSVTDALESLNKGNNENAKEILKSAQKKTEEMYIGDTL